MNGLINWLLPMLIVNTGRLHEWPGGEPLGVPKTVSTAALTKRLSPCTALNPATPSVVWHSKYSIALAVSGRRATPVAM